MAQVHDLRCYLMLHLARSGWHATAGQLWEWYSIRRPMHGLVDLEYKQFLAAARKIFEGMITVADGVKVVRVPPALQELSSDFDYG